MEPVQVNEAAARARFFALMADLLERLLSGKYAIHAEPMDGYGAQTGWTFSVRENADKPVHATPSNP